jgi:AraC-like DNA-binding protein
MVTLRFTRVASLGLEVLHASNLTHAYPAHLHEHDSIGVLLLGEERIHCGDRTSIVRPGEAFIVAAEEVHSGESIGAEYLLMKIVAPRALPTCVIDDPRVAPMLLDLLVKLERQSVSRSQFSRVLDLLSAHQSSEPDEAMPIADVREYVKTHSVAGVSLAEMTAVARLSRFHLLRRFRRIAGVPPHEYQTQLRIARARLLLRGGRPIAEAALRTGFVDQSHLSRHFKRIVGMTPGDYVAQSNIVQDPNPAAR